MIQINMNLINKGVGGSLIALCVASCSVSEFDRRATSIFEMTGEKTWRMEVQTSLVYEHDNLKDEKIRMKWLASHTSENGCGDHQVISRFWTKVPNVYSDSVGKLVYKGTCD